jgi:hypothetical protein
MRTGTNLSAMDIQNEKLNHHYLYLGGWKGLYGSKEEQESIKSFWSKGNRETFSWFLHRLESEHNSERLDAAIDVITSHLPASTLEILAAFENSTNTDVQETMLKAFRWSSEKYTGDSARPLLAMLSKAQKSENKYLREAVYGATRALSEDMARTFLTEALKAELDDDNRVFIKDELWNYQHP